MVEILKIISSYIDPGLVGPDQVDGKAKMTKTEQRCLSCIYTYLYLAPKREKSSNFSIQYVPSRSIVNLQM